MYISMDTLIYAPLDQKLRDAYADGDFSNAFRLVQKQHKNKLSKCNPDRVWKYIDDNNGFAVSHDKFHIDNTYVDLSSIYKKLDIIKYNLSFSS